MSYPGRPPLVQGLPMPSGMAYMQMSGPPPPLMPAVMPIQHMVPMQVTTAPQIRAFPKLNPNRDQFKQIQGPPVTVFVGNITEKAPDTMVRQILATCGPVISWKRVKGFGFCELAGPDAGLRAVRILHDLMVGEKRLVAKVDSKTKAVLDKYKAEKRQKEKGSGSPLQDELEEEEPLDDETKMLDNGALDRIKQLLIEYKDEMNNFELKKEEEVLEKRNKILDEADVEEEKRDLITREIGKFREIMKKQEEEREVSRKKDKEKDGGGRERKDRSQTHSPSPRRRDKDEKKRRRSRSRSRDRVDRDRSRERDRDVRDRDRERERERDRDREMRERERELRERDRDRDRDRERDEKSKSTKELLKEKEMEEEAKEKKKAERRAREKEASYQERLRGWEARERRKAKDYEKEHEKDRIREEEREKDAKRLKEFLEDYDDERDDIKYYKGRELQKRLAERVKEAESDGRDRTKEKEEIDELKNKIFSGEFADPNAEFERIKKEREEQYKPKLLIDVNLEHWKQKEKEKEREIERQRQRDRERDRENEREKDRQRQREEREKYVVQQAAQELAAVEAEPIDSDSDMDNDHFSPAPPEDTSNDGQAGSAQVQTVDEDSRHSLTSNHEEEPPQTYPTMKMTLCKPIVFSPHGQTRDTKRKKLDLREVFNPDDDDTNTQVKKLRKLVPLDYNEDKKGNKKDKENGEKKSDESLKSQEEKRKHIKSLIEKIPTEKDALFAYQLDWSAIDNGLMERKIRPWINKKIIEYIGEPEPTLVDFICSKVMAGSQPQIILEDVQMVLDEEAEVFVVKMWRLLIYEVEAKKLGLVK
ncbi:PREDICTED: RNA-binding protein 25 isoform X2 [Nicrophorus vespilloides]|uniref:RNA-binding protein 25 isoform X2 n=1 Tax=Nicrophorus vespilloides TaxID=110193 RepID=A0ABM1M6R3_NICVS|nr:PREDICTED: RNA-binding protein 25 isoform X2 [Nicrophorus vespilloides]